MIVEEHIYSWKYLQSFSVMFAIFLLLIHVVKLWVRKKLALVVKDVSQNCYLVKGNSRDWKRLAG